MSKDLQAVEGHSLLAYCPDSLRKRIEQIPPDFFSMTEQELASHSKFGKFSVMDKRLRVAFWAEFDRVSEYRGMVILTHVVRGVCSMAHFMDKISIDPVRLAYILTPPTSYRVALEESLDTLVSKMREIAELPIKDEDGEPNYRNINLLMKAFAHIDNRVKGAAVQRIESKSVNLTAQALPNTVNDIDKRLQELEAQAQGTLPTQGAPVARIGVIEIPKADSDE